MINVSFALRRATPVAFALVMTAVIGTPELTAQRQAAALGGRDAGAGMVERAIRLANELDLTQAQREQLEAIRVEALEERTSHAVRFMTLTSEVRAGIREPEAIRQELAAIREGGEAGREAFRSRFTEVFNEDQRQQLRQLARRGAWREPGVRRESRLERQRGVRRQGSYDRGRGGARFRGRGRPGGRAS